MEQLTTENELIAEFMGLKFSQNYESYDDFSFEYKLEKDGLWYSFLEETDDTPYRRVNGVKANGYHHILFYHTSWDWLMPVVEKIEHLGYHVLIEDNFCRIGIELDIRVWTVNKKIECVYSAVCQFIKWYNEKCKSL